MKKEPAASSSHTAEPRRSGVRLPLERLRRSRPGGMLRLPEIIALASSLLLLLAAVLSYFFILRPQRTRVAAAETERAQLERQLQVMRTNVTQGQDTQTSVSEILGSLQKFEIEHLSQSGNGSTAIIEELNRLIRKDSLRISGGLAFTQLEETVPGTEKQQAQAQRESGSQGAVTRVVQSVFPGIGITLTVEGSYPNLRRFIKDVEADRRFIVINSVELEGVTETGGSSGFTSTGDVPTGGANKSVTPGATGARGTLVSLRLDMAAYFRRSGALGDQTTLGPAGGGGLR